MLTDKIIHKELSESIIGAAMKVLNNLKPGLNEKAYENALVIELKKNGHSVQQQSRCPVLYEGTLVDTLVPDFIVDDTVITDSKVVSAFNDTHIAQMIGYLSVTNLALHSYSTSNTRICAENAYYADDRGTTFTTSFTDNHG